MLIGMVRRPDNASDHLRLMVRVARLYHESGLTQPEIAARLSLSQARVSRLLKQAVEVGVVKTTVHMPPGVFADLEEAIERRYGLREAVVVDVGDEEAVIPALGASAATYLETALVGAERVGISSWSETLLATVNAMRPVHKSGVRQVIQVLGGLGQHGTQVQAYATRLTDGFAGLLGAQPVFLPVPGIVGSARVYRSLLQDPLVSKVFSLFDDLSLVLVGIGSLDPSRLIRESGNVLSDADRSALRQAGAVGDVCQRFFDVEGRYLETVLHDRVLGIGPQQLLRVPRRVGVAGGGSKFEAIRAAARGRWVDTLITDKYVAERLIQGGA